MRQHPGHDSRPGDAPSRDAGLPGLPGQPAGFEHDGPWSAAPPSALLAAALEEAAGPDNLYQGADTGALVGIVKQWAAVESWAAAGKLAALRAMMRDDSESRPLLRRRAGLPEGWDDSLNYEIAAALAMGPVSAGNLAGLAWTLGTRLPAIGRLLADGTLTTAKAKLVAQTFEPLDESEASRAEALVLAELAGKTYFQVERLAWRAALAVAPDVAERRRSAAERERARVTVFREESGTVGLSGRDLPAAEALSGHACVLARAVAYEASGAFPGRTSSSLQALAYLDLLNGVPAADRIAFTRTAPADPPDTPAPENPAPGNPSPDSPSPHSPSLDSPSPDAPGPDPRGPESTGPEPESGGVEPDDATEPGGGGAAGSARRRNEPEPGSDITGPAAGIRPGDGRPPDAQTGRENPGAEANGTPPEPPAQPRLPEITIPLATLRVQAGRPGDNRLLGPLDPALARSLALAAARSPASRWEVVVVDEHGYAVGHGIARSPRGEAVRQIVGQAVGQANGQQAPPPNSPLSALPARVTITITEAYLRQLTGEPRPGAPPGARTAWTLVRRTVPRSAPRSAARSVADGYGIWTLTLPGGQELTVRFDVVPVHACDHRYRVTAYLPGDRLRRLVQVRDHDCTFPTCSRPARESDFEHAIPYDQGGPTDACNAGARSRRCHQVKQLPGWHLTQPKPGWHEWTTPTGRTYIQAPWHYLA
jgi:hypothetical protein